MKYIKQLDSLRAIAVILVMINHWITYRFINDIPTGKMGVDIFFVLSGFLITKILFHSRQKAEVASASKGFTVKNFFIRRSLRIFPIYYLTLVVLLFFHKSTETDILPAFGYFVTYTSNYYFFHLQEWDGMISHLWSLSVEEQFYLLWPWIILFVNKKYLRNVIIGFIIIGTGSQYLTGGRPLNHVLTFTCFDAFGLGALLAWQLTYHAGAVKKFFYRLSAVTPIAFVLFVAGVFQHEWPYVPLRTLNAVMALWLITYIIVYAESGKLQFKFVFNNRILIYLGKISYGIYLFHNFVPHINRGLITRYIYPQFEEYINTTPGYLLFLFLNLSVVIILSTLSFYLIEKRFLNLKKYFEYSGTKEVQPEAAGKTGLLYLFSRKK